MNKKIIILSLWLIKISYFIFNPLFSEMLTLTPGCAFFSYWYWVNQVDVIMPYLLTWRLQSWRAHYITITDQKYWVAFLLKAREWISSHSLKAKCFVSCEIDNLLRPVFRGSCWQLRSPALMAVQQSDTDQTGLGPLNTLMLNSHIIGSGSQRFVHFWWLFGHFRTSDLHPSFYCQAL